MTNETQKQKKKIQDYCDARKIPVEAFMLAAALHIVDEQGKK